MNPVRVLLLLGLSLTPLYTLPADHPPPTVAAVDLDRYSGRWYEIAKIPNRFQSHCSGWTTADYRLLPDGHIEVINRCRNHSGSTDEAWGIARSADSETRARLEVSFFSLFGWQLFWGDYWIMYLGPDYDYALVGHPERRYGWILSRTPVLDAATRERIDHQLREAGYTPALFEETRQDSSP